MNAGKAVDHLELWSSAAQLPGFGKHCIDESKVSLSAWSVDTKGAVLGRLHPISADAAHCDLDQGSLVPRLTLGYGAASN